MRRNAGLLLVARVVSAGTTLLVLAIIARVRGAEALGAVGVGFALGSIAAAVSDAGSASLLVREAARRPEAAGSLLGAGLLVRMVTVPLTLGAVAGAALIVSPEALPIIVLVAAGLVGQQTAEVPRSVFNAAQRMTVSASHSIVENVAWMAAVVAGLALGWTLEATFVAALAVMVASVVLGLVLAARLAGVRPRRPARSDGPPLVRMAAPFTAFNVIGIAYSRIDTFLVGALATGAALATAGQYFAATRIVAAFEYVPEAVSRAAYPELARRSAGEGSGIVSLLGRAASTLLLLGGAVPGVLIVAGGSIMGLVYGVDLAAGGWLLAGLALAVPLRFLGYLYGMTLTSADAQGRRVAAAAAALIVVVVVDVAFIPTVGMVAPVVGSIAAATLVLVLYARFVRRRFGVLGLDASLVATVAGATVGTTALGLLVRPALGEPVAAAIATAAYAAMLIAGPARGVLRSALRPALDVR